MLPSVVRVRSGRSPLRGEAARVAERVRAVVGGDPPAGSAEPLDEPAGERAPGPGLLARLGERVGERVPVRVDPGLRAVVAIGVVVVLVALATGAWVLASRPRSMPVADAVPSVAGSALVRSGSAPSGGSGAAASTAPTAPTSAASSAALVVVDVAGKVRRPGLYRLPSGSRVDDAVRAAGGALRGVDLANLNLAAPLVDGQQVAVGRPAVTGGGAGPPAASSLPGAAGAGPAGATGPVNLNTATLDQLDALPGIGPALAQRILDYRAEHGSFSSVDQLDDVSGIGTVTFARLRPLVTV